jgi:preprotein translocase subunit SecA
VLGTERHDSRRIDNQLRGRSGRQGDPGESRFYLSLGDDLMRLFNGAAVERIMDTLNIPDEVPIESKMVTRAIRSAQTQVEQQNFEIRKNVLKYDEVLNKQRTVIYAERRRVLHGDDLHEQVQHMIDDVIRGYVTAATAEGYAEDWDLDELWRALKALYPVGVSVDDLIEASGGERGGLSAEFLIEELIADAHAAYTRREESLGTTPDGEPIMRELERRVVLSVLDRKWREHLYEMDYLQEGIQLRSYGQRDPLVEYQREGFTMFATMMDAIKEESVAFLFNLEVQVTPAEAPAEEAPADAAGEAAQPSTAEAAQPDVEHARASHPRETAETAGATAAGNGKPAGALAHLVAPGLEAPRRPSRLEYSAPTIDGSAGAGTPAAATAAGEGQPAPMYEGTPRNAKCPCGSGKAYKRCHGDPHSVV